MRDFEEVKECLMIIKAKLDDSNKANNEINEHLFKHMQKIKERIDKLEKWQTIR